MAALSTWKQTAMNRESDDIDWDRVREEDAKVDAEFADEENEELKAEIEALKEEMAHLNSWKQREAVIRVAWMKKDFFFTDDLCYLLGKTIRAVNLQLKQSGEEGFLLTERGNNLWRIESLSKLFDDIPENGTSSGGATGKKQPRHRGVTKGQRTGKRSNSKNS